MLNNLDFNRFKTFYHIYQTKSVGKAAKALNVTPSAVSQHLKKFEFELGMSLFTRLHKRLVPTSEANHLFNLIKPFFTELEAGLKILNDGKKEPSGIIRIGAPVEFGKNEMPKIISLFREKFNSVRFNLVLGNSEKLLGMVKKGELDFSLVDLFLSQKQYLSDLGLYQVDPVIDETVVLACSKKYYDSRIKGDLSLANLLAQDYIAYDSSHLALNGWFTHHFGKRLTSIHPVLTVDSIQTIRSAIANHIGLGVITRNRAESENFISIQVGKADIINKISIVQLLDKVPNFTEKSFQAFFKELIRGGV